MRYVRSFAGEPWAKQLKVGATIATGVIAIADTNYYGSVIPSTTTSATDAFGVCTYGATYSTTVEGVADVIINPMAIYQGRASGSGTTGAALTVVTGTGVSKTVLAGTVGTTDLKYGMVYYVTGANAGLCRRSTATSSNASVTVTVGFPNTPAVGDKFIWLPWAPGSGSAAGAILRQTSDFLELDASSATGMDHAACVGIELVLPIDAAAPTVLVDFCLCDSVYNPID